MKKITLLNMLSSFLLQLISICSGFVLPKIILNCFGSEVNGLISSLNLMLNYITILEGGVTGVITANLYKPLVEKDYEKVSSVIVTTEKFYKKIGLIFFLYTMLLAVFYKFIFNIEFGFEYVFWLTIILSLNLFIQYMFSLSYKNLLDADKKGYVVSFTQIFIILLNLFLTVYFSRRFPNVHFLKFISGILFIIQPVIYKYYIDKHYNINKKAIIDKKLIDSRWNGFAINIAAFIHASTDITILTYFSDLVMVSVYSIYNMIVSAIKRLINSICAGITHTIGQALAKGDKKALDEKLELYEIINFVMVFFVFSIAILMITPMVMIYTNGMDNTMYFQPALGILMLISEMIYLLRNPYVDLAYSANKFKEIKKAAYMEALLNIISSIILVKCLGVIGVAIGTIIAMTYRLVYQIWFTKKIFGRNQIIFYKKLIIFSLCTILGIQICLKLPKIKYELIDWCLHGVIYSLIMGVIYIFILIVFYKKQLKYGINYLKK